MKAVINIKGSGSLDHHVRTIGKTQMHSTLFQLIATFFKTDGIGCLAVGKCCSGLIDQKSENQLSRITCRLLLTGLRPRLLA